jgi:hypothetical protein
VPAVLKYYLARQRVGKPAPEIGESHIRSGCTIILKGEHVKKPQGYRQAAAEQCFCLLILCIPYYQSLLLAGISGLISVLLLTFLLLFVVARSPEIYRAVTSCLEAFPSSWVAPLSDRRGLWVSLPSHAVVPGPSLAPSFQRPPPIFS